MPRRTDGFSLIEAAVAIAIMAILAGASLPLVMKAVTQQREQATRASLQLAWSAAFGVQGTRVVNMRADFGFDPPGALTDLGKMMDTNAPFTPVALAYGSHPPAPFFYGWNGPYWSGTLATVAGRKVPADAWGQALQLRNGWQMFSVGADGRANTADDLVYPSAPVNLGTAYLATVYVTFQAPLRQAASPGGTWTWTDRYRGVPRSTAAAISVPANGSVSVPPFSVLPGPLSLTATFPLVPGVVATPPAVSTPPYAAIAYSQILDLLPGEARAITITLN